MKINYFGSVSFRGGMGRVLAEATKKASGRGSCLFFFLFIVGTLIGAGAGIFTLCSTVINKIL